MTDPQSSDQPDRLTIEHHLIGGVRVVVVRGEIDQSVTDVFSEALLPEDGSVPPRIVADLSGVTFLDSSGINVLIAAHRATQSAGGWLRLAAPSPVVSQLIAIVGLDQVIACHPTVRGALCP